MNIGSLILIGGGGHCRSVIDLISGAGTYRIHGVLDVEANVGRNICGAPIIGTDAMIPDLVREGHRFLITAGQVGRTAIRMQLFEMVRNAGGGFATIISTKAYVSAKAEVSDGTSIGHGAIVNSGVRVGPNCIVNTGAIIEHDAVVEGHCHIATGAIVNGGCTIGPGSMIGSRAVLLQGIEVGAQCVIGAGAVVLRNVPSDLTVVGVPAKAITK